MKKSIIVFSVFFGLIGLVGCGSESDQAKQEVISDAQLAKLSEDFDFIAVGEMETTYAEVGCGKTSSQTFVMVPRGESAVFAAGGGEEVTITCTGTCNSNGPNGCYTGGCDPQNGGCTPVHCSGEGCAGGSCSRTVSGKIAMQMM